MNCSTRTFVSIILQVTGLYKKLSDKSCRSLVGQKIIQTWHFLPSQKSARTTKTMLRTTGFSPEKLGTSLIKLPIIQSRVCSV